MTAVTQRDLPFFAPDLFEDDRAVLLDLIREIGLAPAQKFILGEHTVRFEQALRDWLGATDVIACASGTSALTLVLRAMGVGSGDEVVVPAFGCAPLASAVVTLGAVPVFADIDPVTMVVDPHEVEREITGRTKVLMPAHMFSVMADMPRLRALATTHGLRLLEDSAVAQGGVLAGHPAGTWGDAGVFSFVQVKTFGTAGEGGAVVTADAELGRVVRMLRNHGQDGRQRFVHHRIGYNSRFDEVLAAFQLHRFPGLAARLERRARIAEYYTDRFAPLAEHGILAPPRGRDGRCHYVYSLLAERRDDLHDHLAAHGIGSHVYYPRPLPRQPAFAPYARADRSWPHAEHAAARTLAIPVYPHLTDAEVERIADAVCAFPDQSRRASVSQTDLTTGALPAPRAPVPSTPDEIAAEWRRRARRPGLARVMRASQPAELADRVTATTRDTVSAYLEIAARRLGHPVRSALDVGCGIGRLTPTIAGHAEHVVAIDLADEMIAAARQTCAGIGTIDFRRHTAQDLPLRDTTFDVAVCVWVLMHVLDDADLERACRGLAASAGHLVLVECEYAGIPVGSYSRLRSLSDYLRLMPGARVVESGTIDYGGDRSFAALIAFDRPERSR